MLAVPHQRFDKPNTRMHNETLQKHRQSMQAAQQSAQLTCEPQSFVLSSDCAECASPHGSEDIINVGLYFPL